MPKGVFERKPFTEEHRRNIGLAGKGRIPWNKGKPYLQMIGNTNGFQKDHTPWNKGLKGFMGKETNPNWKGGVSYNQEYNNMMQRKRREKHPERIRIMNHNRRIMTSALTLRTLQQVYEDNIKKYGTLTCYLCFNPIEFKKDHLEHKQPLSRGGTNDYENLGIACSKCNLKKNNKTETEFRKELLP